MEVAGGVGITARRRRPEFPCAKTYFTATPNQKSRNLGMRIVVNAEPSATITSVIHYVRARRLRGFLFEKKLPKLHIHD